ncbi:MAG TPA: hypothetical protein PLB92_07660 [Rhodoglobus sp.]|nr:hypothetical protein [Rhodoglobus sp.]
MTETLEAAINALHDAIRTGVPFMGQLNTRLGIFRKVPDHGWQFEARGGRNIILIEDADMIATLERKVS